MTALLMILGPIASLFAFVVLVMLALEFRERRKKRDLEFFTRIERAKADLERHPVSDAIANQRARRAYGEAVAR